MLRIHSLDGNRLSLDGGAMFGNAPKAVWERWCSPDERNRIELSCRCLLVEDGQRRILLETGIGAFFDPALRDRYGVIDEGHALLRSLADKGISHEEIDVVVLSHLHFDHAGGLLSTWQADTPSTLLFPNATYVVGQRQWQRAVEPHMRDRASFIPQLQVQLEESGRLHLLDHANATVLGEQFRLHYSDGHTPGMMHTWIRGQHHSVFFCADLIPGVAWVHLPITMGYDRYPEQLIDEKTSTLDDIAGENGWLFFTHDPKICMAQVGTDQRGRRIVTNPLDDTPMGGLDLDKENMEVP